MLFVLIFHNFPVRQKKLKRVTKYKKFIRQHIGYVSSSLNIGDHFSSRNDPTVGGNQEFEETRIEAISFIHTRREVAGDG